tara:strand:+ start:328 stop:999 length:672 start_codon:yes stop_codon:yes gene_type:complete
MAYIGKTPTPAPLTSSDIASDIINSTHIGDTAISGFDALATAPADTDEFLISDGGVLKRLDASLVGGGGITEADNWRLTANSNAGTAGYVTSNWERNDTAGFSKIGTGLSESSGVFSFASTGIYLINFFGQFIVHGGDINAQLQLYTTINNSSYTLQSLALVGQESSSDDVRMSASNSSIFDVTDTSQCKFKFYTDSFSSSTLLLGNTSYNFTGFTSIRLGDT